MYKIIEQFNKNIGKIVYTVLDENNEKLCDFISKKDAEKFIKVWESMDHKEGRGCNV